jgi:DNA-binding SARP family transcriptional activator/predicted Zn-dependent protease/TolB-like protein
MLRLRTFGGLSLEQDGRPLAGAATQRRRLALLAILAAAGERGVSRDKLLAFLWPERDAERGRHALAQALYALRRDLGETPIVEGSADLRLNRAALTCDLVEFEETRQRGDEERAADLYTGPFLDGFFISDAPGFERWVEEERARFGREALELFGRLARGAAARGDLPGAVRWWRRLATADPLDRAAALGLMESLAAAGDPIGALQHAGVYETRLREELEVGPDPAVAALVKRLRRDLSGMQRDSGPRAAPAGAPPTQPAAEAARAPHPRRRPSAIVVAGGSVAVAALLVGAVVLARRVAPAAPLIAVGAVRDYSAGDTAVVDHALTDMLATNLARVPGLQVVSNSRMYELLGQPAAGGDVAAAFARAARRAGAAEIIEGGLYRRGGGGLRFDVRRTDLGSGAVTQAYSVEGRDPFELVDRATTELAAGFRVRAPADVHVADVTTRSLVAYRFYEEGLREFYGQSDVHTARPFFLAALAEDSAFAMAEYYAALCEITLGVRTAPDRLSHAVLLADRASDRERLVIDGFWAWYWEEPARLAIAETLATRYPAEPDGHYLLGRALMWGGDFLGAVLELRRVVTMDSAAFRGVTARCLACDAMATIVSAYQYADTMPAAEQAAREWTRRQPDNGAAWGSLADVLEYEGRFDEALAATHTGMHLSGGTDDLMLRARLAMRAGNFAESDRLLEQRMPAVDWFLMISLRAQGRLREALALARASRRRADRETGGRAPPSASQPEAIVLFDMGRGREAAALFEAIAAAPGFPVALRARAARERTWNLTHAATALAAVGDTTALAVLADSLEHEGARSAYGRDHLLHHYVRGLLLAARGRLAAAAAEYRRGLFSTTAGYTRNNYELARTLLALHRPAEAIGVLQPAFRGSVEASNSYVTLTELDELLARAFDEAHQADSAAAHYRRVVAAWRAADPQFRDRYEHARERLNELEPRARV